MHTVRRTPATEPCLIDVGGVLHDTHCLLPPVVPAVAESHAVTQLENLS